MAIVKKVEATNKTADQFLNLVLVGDCGTFLGYVNIPKRLFNDPSNLTAINQFMSQGVHLEHKKETSPLF